MEDLVSNLQKAYEVRINKVDWMSDSTKKIAVDKLHAFIKKIGYPDKWRQYNLLKSIKIVITGTSFLCHMKMIITITSKN